MMYKGVGSKLNVNKSEFYEEMKKSKEMDKLTDKAVDYFIKMAVHGVRHGKLHYPDYRDEEDCIQAALYDALKRWKQFDAEQYTDPFAFFSSVIFNGYANQFKAIHKHRFIKTSSYTIINYDSDFNLDKIKEKITDVYSDLNKNVREMDIKRVRIRIKNGKSSKWQLIKMHELDDIEKYHEDFQYIKTLEIKIDYNSGVSFVNLDQDSDESEIFNI